MAELSLLNVSKSFGPLAAVDNVTLTVQDREFLTLLGPSGCGKTTTLRMIAGFVQPDAGEIRSAGQIIASPKRGMHLPPEARKMSMVFQNYALWPHMTVIDNTMFGLRTRGIAAGIARRKAMDALQLVRMHEMSGRYPHELSGGQQQRVSLARAIAREPSILLMDEPLSNLDAKFRETLRLEIKELHRKLRITSVYVTHDQAEAMVMSDRVCVMWQGRILQSAAPADIYRKPECRQVAEFIGQTNFLAGRVRGRAERGVMIETRWGCLEVADDLRPRAAGEAVTISARPESIHIAAGNGPASASGLPGRILNRIYLGNLQEYWIDIGDKVLRVQSPVTDGFREGDHVALTFDPEWMAVIEGIHDQ